MAATISSFFTINSSPALGLSPTISIWKVSTNELLVNGAVMTSVGGGFYKFEFTELAGFDENLYYTVRTDGGITVPAAERISVGKIGPEIQDLVSTAKSEIAGSVWDQPTSGHNTSGSFGKFIQDMAYLQPAEIATIADAVWDEDLASHNLNGSTGNALSTALDLMRTLLKYSSNRTRIDKNLRTLTVYDDDGVTVVKTFSLRDSGGASSVTEVFERQPL